MFFSNDIQTSPLLGSAAVNANEEELLFVWQCQIIY
jgi:hypothetical protein